VTQSNVNHFNEQSNLQVNVREYLVEFLDRFPITTSNSLKMQSKTLAQLTASTNELTRNTLVCLSVRPTGRAQTEFSFFIDVISETFLSDSTGIEKDGTKDSLRRRSNHYSTAVSMCNQSVNCKVSSFDVPLMKTSLFLLSSKAVNGPLQERMNTLSSDYSRINKLPADYDTDLESQWSILSRI
jgi:hypothetical protein